MLVKKLKRSAKFNEDGAVPELIGKDLERNIDNVDSKMELDNTKQGANMKDEDQVTVSPKDEDAENPAETEETAEETPAAEVEETPAEELPPENLETEMNGEEEETFKDINEQVVVYLYRGFAEIGDQVRLFTEDEGNEERDPELLETLQQFMEGYQDVMAVVKDLAKKYVTSVELFDPEEGEQDAPAEEPEDTEEPAKDGAEEPEEDYEDELESMESVVNYAKEHNFDHEVFESECEIYARYKNAEEADKFESELKQFKGAEVFRHEDIGEVHAYIKVRK